MAASSLLSTAASAHAGGHGGASTSRSCLTGAARAVLARIEQRFGPMQLVSTCRPGARVAGSGRPSLHASGNAIDFNAGSRKGEVVQWLIANHHGGIMTYGGMSHIHVDVGPRFVSLGSGGGRFASASSYRRVGGGGSRRARSATYYGRHASYSGRTSRSSRRYVGGARSGRATYRASVRYVRTR